MEARRKLASPIRLFRMVCALFACVAALASCPQSEPPSQADAMPVVAQAGVIGEDVRAWVEQAKAEAVWSPFGGTMIAEPYGEPSKELQESLDELFNRREFTVEEVITLMWWAGRLDLRYPLGLAYELIFDPQVEKSLSPEWRYALADMAVDASNWAPRFCRKNKLKFIEDFPLTAQILEWWPQQESIGDISLAYWWIVEVRAIQIMLGAAKEVPTESLYPLSAALLMASVEVLPPINIVRIKPISRYMEVWSDEEIREEWHLAGRLGPGHLLTAPPDIEYVGPDEFDEQYFMDAYSQGLWDMPDILHVGTEQRVEEVEEVVGSEILANAVASGKYPVAIPLNAKLKGIIYESDKERITGWMVEEAGEGKVKFVPRDHGSRILDAACTSDIQGTNRLYLLWYLQLKRAWPDISNRKLVAPFLDLEAESAFWKDAAPELHFAFAWLVCDFLDTTNWEKEEEELRRELGEISRKHFCRAADMAPDEGLLQLVAIWAQAPFDAHTDHISGVMQGSTLLKDRERSAKRRESISQIERYTERALNAERFRDFVGIPFLYFADEEHPAPNIVEWEYSGHASRGTRTPGATGPVWRVLDRKNPSENTGLDALGNLDWLFRAYIEDGQGDKLALPMGLAWQLRCMNRSPQVPGEQDTIASMLIDVGLYAVDGRLAARSWAIGMSCSFAFYESIHVPFWVEREIDPHTGQPESDLDWWERQEEFIVDCELAKLVDEVMRLKTGDIRETSWREVKFGDDDDLTHEQWEAKQKQEDEEKERWREWLMDDRGYHVKLKLDGEAEATNTPAGGR